MSKPRVIQADFANWRPVNGRKVLQLIFEVPIESTHDILTMLGTPTPGESKWCAIALLNKSSPHSDPISGNQSDAKLATVPVNDEIAGSREAEGGSPKKPWQSYKPSQQAAILCNDPDFQRYFNVEGPKEAAEKLRLHLKIESRSDLDETFANAERWMEFVALYNMHRDRLK